jgi:acetylornithine deacetylase/succinyl-diaminopimelate desuccinylase-like protein
MAVYGVPLFRKEGELRMHSNDERIGVDNLKNGAGLLQKIVLKVSASQ